MQLEHDRFFPEETDLPEAPARKKGFSRLIEILANYLERIFLSGTLMLLACVPAVSLVALSLQLGSLSLCLLSAFCTGWLIGPAMAGFFDTILRIFRSESCFWWHTYKKVWKRYFKKSLLPGSVFAALWALLVYFAFVIPQAFTVPLSLAYFVLLDAVLLLTLGIYFWMQLPLLDLPVQKILSNSVRMLVGFLPQTALAAFFQILYWLVMAYLIPRCAFVFLLTGLWLPLLLAMMAVYSPFEKALKLGEGQGL